MTAPRPRRQRKGDRLLAPGAVETEIRVDYAVAPFDRAALFSDSHGGGDMIELKRAERCYQHQTALTKTRPLGGPTMADSRHICSVDGCGNPSYVRSFCNAHYLRWRRHGSPHGGAVSKGEPLRWLKQVAQNCGDECIEWPFASNGNGYGWAYFEGKRIGAHRLSLVLHTGENPKGKVAAHGCHNRACVNPRHLSWHDQSMNMLQTSRGPGRRDMKLNLGKVRHIRECGDSAAKLAKHYGVSISTIYKVRSGTNWHE